MTRLRFSNRRAGDREGGRSIVGGVGSAGQQLIQRRQRARVRRSLAVDLLQTQDIRPNPLELRAHDPDAIGERRRHGGVVAQVLQIEGRDAKRHLVTSLTTRTETRQAQRRARLFCRPANTPSLARASAGPHPSSCSERARRDGHTTRREWCYCNCLPRLRFDHAKSVRVRAGGAGVSCRSRHPLRATSKSCYMRPAFRRRSPSSRIRPIARCSLSSSRAGASGWCRTARVLGTDFLNLSGAISSGGERGLLGMALAPDYASSGRFFVNFTNPAGHTVVARFQRIANPLVADPSTRFDLRWNGANGPAYIAQPFANHNGGWLAFGPDGYLYIGMGDGGDGNDPGNRAQNPSELLGKMLRVDVNLPGDDAIGYRVPANNPFVSGAPVAARTEIWAFGLRNPWRFSFDDPGARRHRCAGHRRRRTERVGGSRLRAGRPGRPQLRVAGARRQPRQCHLGAAGLSAALRPDPRVRSCRRSSRSPAATSIAAPRCRTIAAAISLPTTSRAGSGRSASRLTGTVRPRRTRVTEHTASLSQLGALGNVSSFGVDADGELFIVSYSRGAILRLVSTAPTTPTGLRIIRP